MPVLPYRVKGVLDRDPHDPIERHDAPQQPQSDPEPLHVCEVVKAAGQWFAVCACRKWVSAAQDTLQAAASLHCGIEDAHVDGQRNRYVLTRKLAEDREFGRLFPPRPQQVR